MSAVGTRPSGAPAAAPGRRRSQKPEAGERSPRRHPGDPSMAADLADIGIPHSAGR